MQHVIWLTNQLQKNFPTLLAICLILYLHEHTMGERIKPLKFSSLITQGFKLLILKMVPNLDRKIQELFK